MKVVTGTADGDRVITSVVEVANVEGTTGEIVARVTELKAQGLTDEEVAAAL